MAKYTIDYIEENKGFEIVESVEAKIKELKEQFRYGEITYDEMIYGIGSAMRMAGCALADECHYADKDETEDMYYDDDRCEEDLKQWIAEGL